MMTRLRQISILLSLLVAMCTDLNAQFYNYHYNPNNTDIPTQLTLPQNVSSLAEDPSTGSVATMGNFVESATDHGMLHIVDGAGLLPSIWQDARTSQIAGELDILNSVIFAYNTTSEEVVMAGGRQFGSAYVQDMYVTKRDNGGSIWGIRLGNGSPNVYIEEARVIVHGAPGEYLIAGVTNQFGGVNNPFIAKVTDNGSSVTLNWANVYVVSTADGTEPTSVFYSGSDGFYIVGEHGTNEIFAFMIDGNGVMQTNFITYSNGNDAIDRMPYIDQNAQNNTVISYTTGNVNGTAIGLMNVTANLTTVNWNYTYGHYTTPFLHGVAVKHSTSGYEYALAIGFNNAASFSDCPGLLRTDLTGKPVAALRYNVHGEYDRTQSMLKNDDAYIIKTLYSDLEGHGLIKVDQQGFGDNTDDVCETSVEISESGTQIFMGMVSVQVTSLGSPGTSGIGNFFDRSGTISDCDGSGLGTYSPNEVGYSDDVEDQTIDGKIEIITSVNDREHELLLVYPNPNSGVFQIELSSELPHVYNVRDITGKLIVSGTGYGKTQIDLTGHNKGVYVLEVVQDGLRTLTNVYLQ